MYGKFGERIVSVLFLIGLFAGISSYLIIIGLTFIGLSYLIVYIGAVKPSFFRIEMVYFLSLSRLLLLGFKHTVNNLIYIYNIVSIEIDSLFVRCFQGDESKGSNIAIIRIWIPAITRNNLAAAPALVPRRSYSTGLDSLTDEFYEWLVGFVDAEGCFRIKNDTRRPKAPFEFIINLHKDDRKALEYIKNTLGLGNVTERGNTATFSVSRRIDVKVIIDIFSRFSLNTTKRLDFEDWKLAFELWSSVKEGRDYSACVAKIMEIKAGMNKGRDYETCNFKDFRITKNWLLGFIEGDGAFSITKSTFANRFSLGQVSRERPLLEKICDFLYESKQLTDKYGLAIAVLRSKKSEIY